MLEKKQFKIGIGFDAHKFDLSENINNEIVLGGIKIPYIRSMLAHSDGDVVIHAVVDAILGAIGEGDIGEHFPDSNPKWKGQDSAFFLKHACLLLANKNANIANVDIIIVCEAPKVTPYKKQIKVNLSEIMQIPAEHVNVKATTTEKMGFTGRGEGIAVYATVMINI
jgi:2-C-methyl-D-erythritol 2,4-cyclodiphosphate synthase